MKEKTANLKIDKLDIVSYQESVIKEIVKKDDEYTKQVIKDYFIKKYPKENIKFDFLDEEIVDEIIKLGIAEYKKRQALGGVIVKENSIEEEIERIAKLITTKFNNDYSIDNVDKEAIEELLKAYKELKEIEESHRKENGELREKVKQLEEENKTLNERNQYLVKYRAKLEKELYESNENYIPVSLVEEKIEEINKAYEDSKDENGESEYYYPDYTIRVLEGLLEKRK